MVNIKNSCNINIITAIICEKKMIKIIIDSRVFQAVLGSISGIFGSQIQDGGQLLTSSVNVTRGTNPLGMFPPKFLSKFPSTQISLFIL